MQSPIYLDHAATTPLSPDTLARMLPYFSEHFGNPSAIHSLGAAAKDAVDTARSCVARALNAVEEEIVFTSGGTEANNMAIRGAAVSHPSGGRHLLTTPIEHHAVLEPMETLARRYGFELEYIPVDSEGRVRLIDVATRMRDDTVLVSVMFANNEVGVTQPIADIGAICRDRGVYFHTDAVQAVGKLPIDVKALKIDLLSLSAHKFYGPKGIGALYVRRGVPLLRYQDGGGQERGRRAGTLNVPGIAGLGSAIEASVSEMTAEAARLCALRDGFIEQVIERIPGTRLTGSSVHRLPGNIHLTFDGIEGEPVLLALDAAGIYASAGSACSAGSTEPSHVLKAIGMDRDRARSALRLTLGRSTTCEMLDYTVDVLDRAVSALRNLNRA